MRRVAELEEAVRQKEVLLESAQAQIAERRKLAEEAEERGLKERNKRGLMEDELKVGCLRSCLWEKKKSCAGPGERVWGRGGFWSAISRATVYLCV